LRAPRGKQFEVPGRDARARTHQRSSPDRTSITASIENHQSEVCWILNRKSPSAFPLGRMVSLIEESPVAKETGSAFSRLECRETQLPDGRVIQEQRDRAQIRPGDYTAYWDLTLSGTRRLE
jgi:hypothetical protein